MTRIHASQPLAWMARHPGDWGVNDHRQAGDSLGTGNGYRPAQDLSMPLHAAGAPASRLLWLDSSSAGGMPSVISGHLVASGGGEISRDLLRIVPGRGLAAFSCAAPPARGLVAQVDPGEVALALRNGMSVGLAVEPIGLDKLPQLLSHTLADFGHLPGPPPEWAVGLDIGPLTAEERDSLRRISTEFRLGVQDLPQGLWVVDRLGGLHADWPVGARFEPDPR